MPHATAEPSEQVLSTLNKSGSRRWLFPRVSKGRYLARRRLVAYALLVLYNALPWIPINGKPAILLNLPAHEFTFFGTTFLPTDTLLLMLFFAGVFVLIFLLTALFGRVWCGWACPQTVYMEFVYRPIERLFEGAPSAAGKRPANISPWRVSFKYVAFFIVSLHLAHTFLAYFVGPQNLFDWTMQSPFEHPRAFLLVMGVTGLMVFDFCYFREQTCILACPYGRFQSVLLDKKSLIISYDDNRGEPRTKKTSRLTVKGQAVGDCIDCRMCVTTCPTGIDIREGLQMECVGCAQCIDACDYVMDSIGRSRGLIRYSSQEAMESAAIARPMPRRLLRPRVIIYPTLLIIITIAFIVVLLTQPAANVTLLRLGNSPYTLLDDGHVRNDVRIKIVNRTTVPRNYSIEVTGLEDARLTSPDLPLFIKPGETATAGVSVILPRGHFQNGYANINFTVSDGAGFTRTLGKRLQGPFDGPTATLLESHP